MPHDHGLEILGRVPRAHSTGLKNQLWSCGCCKSHTARLLFTRPRMPHPGWAVDETRQSDKGKGRGRAISGVELSLLCRCWSVSALSPRGLTGLAGIGDHDAQRHPTPAIPKNGKRKHHFVDSQSTPTRKHLPLNQQITVITDDRHHCYIERFVDSQSPTSSKHDFLGSTSLARVGIISKLSALAGVT